MKHSNIIGVIASVLLIIFCFLPWVYIQSIDTVVTGIQTGATNYGKPGFMHIVLSVIATILFITPKVWAKRTNIFVATFNLAWSFRNYLLITHCEMGECPEKKWGIYAIMIVSFIVFMMTLLPKMSIKTNEMKGVD